MRYSRNMLPACVALAQVMGTTLVAAAPLAQVDDCGVPQVPNLYKRDADAQLGISSADVASSSAGKIQKRGLERRGLYSLITGLLGKNCSTKGAQQDGQGLPREQAPTGASQRQEIVRQEDDNVVVTFSEEPAVTPANTGVSGTGVNANSMNVNPNYIDLGSDMNRLPFPALESGNNPFIPSTNAREFYREPNLRSSLDSIADANEEPVINTVYQDRPPLRGIRNIDLREPEVIPVQNPSQGSTTPRRGFRQYLRDKFGGNRSKSPVSGGMNDMSVAHYEGTTISANPNRVASPDVSGLINAGLINPQDAPLTSFRNQQRARSGNPSLVNIPESNTIISDQLLEGLQVNPELDAIRGPTRLVLPLGGANNARERQRAQAWDELYGPEGDVEVNFPQGGREIDLTQIDQNYLQPNNILAEADSVANLNPGGILAGDVVLPNANPNVIAQNVNAEIANEIASEIVNGNILPADINSQAAVLENAIVNDIVQNAAEGANGGAVDPNGERINQTFYESFSDQLGVDPNYTGVFGGDPNESLSLTQSQILPNSLLASQVGGLGGAQQGGNSNVPVTIIEEDQVSIRSDAQDVDNGNDSRDIDEYGALEEEEADVVNQNLPVGGQLQNVAGDQLYASFAPGSQ
ncbi:hypothetical protein TWF696_000922 [Orbilia brochopaga]|uniref:Uncharacterized protein n=1 Tax=Orbilia brochopaga TaxID=3140254 RepID=A0AAV9VJ40_9PEZI